MPYDRGFDPNHNSYSSWTNDPQDMPQEAGPWAKDGMEPDDSGSNFEGRFVKPRHIGTAQDHYGSNEVGLVHPNRNSFIRIRDNGDIEISATDGCSIILSATQRTVIVNADEVRFSTNVGGFSWNKAKFNDNALSFKEPALVSNLFDSTNQFLLSSTQLAFVQEALPPQMEKRPIVAPINTILPLDLPKPSEPFVASKPKMISITPTSSVVSSNTGDSHITVMVQPIQVVSQLGTPPTFVAVELIKVVSEVVAPTVTVTVTNGSWQRIAQDLPPYGPSAVWSFYSQDLAGAPNGYLYCLGAVNNICSGAKARPTDLAWSEIAHGPPIIGGAGTNGSQCLVGTNIYFTRFSYINDGVQIQKINEMFCYDTVDDSWVVLTGSDETDSIGSMIFGPDGLIYGFGGVNFLVGPSGHIVTYDPDTDTWETLSAVMPAMAYKPAVVLGADGLFYFIFGDGAGDDCPFWSFDPGDQTWTSLSGLPLPLDTPCITALPDGRIAVAGGFAPPSYDPNTFTYAYIPSSDLWYDTGDTSTCDQPPFFDDAPPTMGVLNGKHYFLTTDGPHSPGVYLDEWTPG